jgi:hypothetical protein
LQKIPLLLIAKRIQIRAYLEANLGAILEPQTKTLRVVPIRVGAWLIFNPEGIKCLTLKGAQ